MTGPALPRNLLRVIVLTAVQAAAVNLPYNPTHIILSNLDDDNKDTGAYAYVLQPKTDSSGQASLLSLDLAKSLDASNISLTTLYETLPFLDSTSNRAFTPLKGNKQNITVVAGDCAADGASPEVWTFIPAERGQKGNGTWTQSTPSTDTSSMIEGPDFLSSGIAFSELAKGNASTTNLYVFGGMCPWINSTSDTWVSSANYTNQMITFSPMLDKTKQVAYTPAFLSSKGPPVEEAGFSMTPLEASYSDNSSSTQSAQQSFVLIGGHTEDAFINMSSVALFSLPEETWTYISVDQPSGTKTDLATRDTVTSVEPRSGHTAILTEDGKSVILFGGWVGDVTNAASPQLAVLELGAGYGGDGDWAWSIPSDTGTNTLSGAGIYGHGAAMLPGGVMMIMGGYSIPSTSTKRLLRRATTTTSSQTLFYNVTSQSWLSSYNPPASVTSSVSMASDRKGALTTTSQKTGLGVGLSIGAVAVALLIIFYFWYKRHLKRRREAREGDKERLFRSGNNFEHAWFGSGGNNGYEAHQGEYSSGGIWDEKIRDSVDGMSYAPYGAEGSHPMVEGSSREAERTGLFVDIPSPTRGLRKGAPSRGQYHAAPRYDESRLNRTSGNIHPIQEEEEKLSLKHSNSNPAECQYREMEKAFNERRDLDPFRDPLPNPLRSHPVSPEIGSPLTNTSRTTNGTDHVSNWIREWTNSYAATLRPTSDNPYTRTGKVDERTSSNLSEQSERSGLSVEGQSVARTSSTRSALFFGLSGVPSITPSQAQTSPISRSKSPAYWDARSRQGALSPTRPGLERNADSVSTACTTWGQLMAEGEALLGNPSQPVAPLNVKTRPTSAELLANAGPTPPLPPRRRMGWMGSIRKALGAERSLSSSHTSNMLIGGPMAQIPPQQYYDRSNTNSPTKLDARAGASSSMSRASVPRRAASDGSEVWRVKRGKRDWERNNGDARWEPYRDEPDTGDWGNVPDINVEGGDGLRDHSDDDREEWDIEEAAANRDVQVMFTVPKARLRVVNADVEKASLRSVSDSTHSIRARNMSCHEEPQQDKTEPHQRKPSNYGIHIQDWEREALEKRDREEEELCKKSE